MSFNFNLVNAAFLVLLYCFAGGRTLTETEKINQADQRQVLTVAYCALTADSDKFDKKIVRVKASLFLAGDSFYLYDLSCRNHTVYPRFVCEEADSCKQMREIIGKNSTGDPLRRRVELVVEGRFNGSQNEQKKYGLRGEFNYQLTVLKIEKASPISDETPWPADNN